MNDETNSKSPLNDRERLAALDESGLLDKKPEETFDRLTRIVAQTLNVPVSLVSLVTDDQQVFKSQQGLSEPWSTSLETPLSHSFCQHVVTSGEVFVVDDAVNDARVCDNLAIPDLSVSAYLGVPIRDPDGFILGSLCAIDSVPRKWTDADEAALKDVAAIVEDSLLLRREISNKANAETQQDLLIQELHHRIKNILATVNSVVSLSYADVEDHSGMREKVLARIEAISRGHEIVHRSIGSLTTLRELVTESVQPFAKQKSNLELEGERILLDEVISTQLSMVFHELATNASKYGALSVADGCVRVHWQLKDKDALHLTWRESGGPQIEKPSKQGFGSRLIKSLTEHFFEGSSAFRFLTDGLEVELNLILPENQTPNINRR